MARYKTIDIRIWLDEKFLSLDEGTQLLFIYLLTSQHTTSIGTLSLPAHVIAAWLQKDIDTVSKRLDTLSKNGLIKVSSVGLVWIRNYLKYNPPANPKVASGYCKFFDEMPECELQSEVAEAVISACKSRGPEYLEVVEAKLSRLLPSLKKSDCIETVSKPYRNQEQEQEYISTNVDKKEKYKKEKKLSKSKIVLDKPEDVPSSQIWSDFLALRNARHAPLTETALNIIRKEAEKAGITLEQALETCCMRGWQGFKAEWYLKGQNASRYQPHQPRDLEPEFRPEDYEGGLISDLMQR